MMTTRRSFLKGTLAGAVALVAGVKLEWSEREEVVEVTPDVTEQGSPPSIYYRANEFNPRDQIIGWGQDVEIDGHSYKGVYTLTFTEEQSKCWFPQARSARYLAAPLYTELEMTLWIDQVVDEPWMVPGVIVPVQLDCGIRCMGRVEFIACKTIDDRRWFVDLMMTCHDVVQEYAV